MTECRSVCLTSANKVQEVSDEDDDVFLCLRVVCVRLMEGMRQRQSLLQLIPGLVQMIASQSSC